MRFIPVKYPFFPLSGLLVLHAVLVFALSKDRRRCSRAYVNGLCLMELTILSVTMASFAPSEGLVTFWNMLLVASRCALCPSWLWMALDASGLRPGGLDARKAYLIALAPVLAFAAILFTNSLHHWYWPRSWFEGRVLVAERGALFVLNTIYSQALLVASSGVYLVALIRHRGNERLRLLVLAIAYAFLFVGDWAWRLEIPLFHGVNPLSFFMTISFYFVGLSVLLYGFPRVAAPITDESIRAMPSLALPSPGPREPASFDAPRELTERQLGILRMVMEGLPYKAIAADIGIAERTVKYHMGQILDKCGLETREQLIAWAALRGLYEPPRQEGASLAQAPWSRGQAARSRP